MDARPKSIASLFDSKIHYFAPMFQRAYVWNRERNWQPLWDDIIALAEELASQGGSTGAPHFLGAIVIEQTRSPTGIDRRQLIDGQQRLTTLQILFAVIRDFIAEFRVEHPDVELPNFDDLIINQNLFGISDENLRYKVWPTKRDQEAYVQVLKSGGATKLREQLDLKPAQIDASPNLLASAYLFFDSELRGWVLHHEQEHEHADAVRHCVIALWRALQDGLQLVSIELDERDNPQVIFETLNARGTPLLQSDLIKNYLFYEAQQRGSEAKDLYDRHWGKQFDEERSAFWKKEVRQGRLRLPHLEIFLRYYLAMKAGRDVSRSNLFEEYKRYMDPQREGAPSILEQFEELNYFGSIYFDLNQLRPNSEFPGSRVRRFLEQLEVLDTKTLNPVLMALAHRFGRKYESQAMTEVLIDLDSYLVRRMVCRLSDKNFNKQFAEMAERVLSDDDFSRESFQRLLLAGKANTSLWPDDRIFQRNFVNAPSYKRLAQKRVRLVLNGVEEELRTNKSEEITVKASVLTIEHLLPQGWDTAAWPLPEDKENDAEFTEHRNTLLHSFGNLTLLTQELNSSISNGPWEQKREALKTHSALALNRQLVHEDNWETWDEASILERGQALFEHAAVVWPYPVELAQRLEEEAASGEDE